MFQMVQRNGVIVNAYHSQPGLVHHPLDHSVLRSDPAPKLRNARYPMPPYTATTARVSPAASAFMYASTISRVR